MSIEGYLGTILKSLKDESEKYLNGNVNGGVISVPVFYKESERLEILSAWTKAGFHSVRLINNTTAAALSFLIRKGPSSIEQNLVVCCLELCHSSIAVLRLSEGVIETLGSFGGTKSEIKSEKLLSKLEICLKELKIGKDIIDDLVVVERGDVCKFKTEIEEFFEGKKIFDIVAELAVGCGAMIQGGILSQGKMLSKVLVVDSGSFSLRFSLDEVWMTKHHFSFDTNQEDNIRFTFHDQQTTVKVYEFENNKVLGIFGITEIHKAYNGLVTVKMMFNMDANGVLNLSATAKLHQEESQNFVSNTSIVCRHLYFDSETY